MSNLSEKAVAFLAKNPAFLGSVAGVRFYECPSCGDEVPMRAIDRFGKLRKTFWYDLPDASELTGKWWSL